MKDLDFPGRPRKAQGPDRPVYFNQSDVDRVMSVVLALASEVAALRERLDTHERVADAGAAPAHARVEAYLPDQAALADRDAWREAYIRRLFRVFSEDVEALRAQPGDPLQDQSRSSND
jgi:hypothetical protein